jgi:hypothetical protein
MDAFHSETAQINCEVPVPYLKGFQTSTETFQVAHGKFDFVLYRWPSSHLYSREEVH